ncbi:MAG: (5-formylfuran-3-yl)methyl phosphate synthase [Planctomycetota bacterium]|nr:(5-formylfuran-3-yl)methyl phosphate synthase [Planctomycetota bacterium]
MDSMMLHPCSLRLLVSVRNLQEALMAHRVGVDILDVKEPTVGALGKADNLEIAKIIKAINGLTPVSAALGEIEECESFFGTGDLPEGLSFAKCGLAGSIHTNWRNRIDWIWKRIKQSCQPVAVGYADWKVAQSPCPEDILQHAMESRIGYFLLDTYAKDGKRCFDKIGIAQLQQLILSAKQKGIRTVLAGTISEGDLDQVTTLAPDFVGVRGAVCEGGRQGGISKLRLREFKSLLT